MAHSRPNLLVCGRLYSLSPNYGNFLGENSSCNTRELILHMQLQYGLVSTFSLLCIIIYDKSNSYCFILKLLSFESFMAKKTKKFVLARPKQPGKKKVSFNLLARTHP